MLSNGFKRFKHFILPSTGSRHLHVTGLVIAAFAWLTLNAAVTALILAYSLDFSVSPKLLVSSPWPLIITAVHLLSAGAALYPLSSVRPSPHHVPHPHRLHFVRDCLKNGGLYMLMLVSINFAVFALPHTTFGILLISSFLFAVHLSTQPWSLLTLSALKHPTYVSLYAFLLSIAAHATAVQSPVVLVLFLTLTLTLKFTWTAFKLVPTTRCRAPISAQLLSGGVISGILAAVVSLSNETQWHLTYSPCPGSILLVLPAICSAAVALIAYAAATSSSTSDGGLHLSGLFGLTGASALWLWREFVGNFNSEAIAALCLSALAFGLTAWSVTQFSQQAQESSDYNQIIWDAETPPDAGGAPSLYDYSQLDEPSEFEIRAFLLGSCILTAAALYLTFLLPCPVILGPRRASLSTSVSFQEPLHVLVTGGAGFVGSHFVRNVLASNLFTRVTIIDNLSTAGIHTVAPLIHKYGRDRVHFVYDDVANGQQLHNVLLKSRINAVVHLASPKIGDSGECEHQCRRTIVDGTQAILAAVAKVQPSARVIFGSSFDVYGPPKGTSSSFAEHARLNPVTPFAKALVDAEQLVFSHARVHSGPVFVLRLFPIVGPTAVPEPARGNPRRWTGAGIGLGSSIDGTERVHITDATDALYRTLIVPPVPGMIGAHTFNIGSGFCVNDSDSPCTTADIQAAAHHLGYQPKHHRIDMGALESALAGADPRNHPEYQDLLASLGTSPWLLPRNLLRPIHEPLTNDLAAIAAHVSTAASTKNKITIVPYQKGYRPLAENTLYSLTAWGKVSNVMMFAIDAESARECLYYNIPCYNATSLAEADFTDSTKTSWKFRQAMWSVISWVKPRLVKRLLDMGYTVVMSDTDISYIREVWKSHESYMEEVRADMVISAEFINNFIANTGNYIVRPSPQVSSFFDEYLAVGKSDPTISDQHAWAAVYRRLGMHYCQSRNECDAQRAHGFMPVRDHSAFFGRNIVCPRPIDICKPDLMYVHPICMGGRDNKINSIKSFGAWFMSEEASSAGYYCQEEKRAIGAAECIGVPKALIKGYVAGMEEEWKRDEGGPKCLGSRALLTNADDN